MEYHVSMKGACKLIIKVSPFYMLNLNWLSLGN